MAKTAIFNNLSVYGVAKIKVSGYDYRGGLHPQCLQGLTKVYEKNQHWIVVFFIYDIFAYMIYLHIYLQELLFKKNGNNFKKNLCK